MERRSEARSLPAPWLERLAWNAAALAALAVMLLVLLGSLEWLAPVAPQPRSARAAATEAPGERASTPEKTVVARRGRPTQRRALEKARAVIPSSGSGAGDCVPVASGSG